MSRPRILILNGSLHQGSSTSVIVKELSLLFPNSVQVDLYEDLSLPHFNDPQNLPESVLLFTTLLQQADGILICTPEYAFGIPGEFKKCCRLESIIRNF